MKIKQTLLDHLSNLVLFCFCITISATTGHSAEQPTFLLQLGHSSAVSSMDFSADGKYLISGSWDNSLKLWDVAQGRLIRTFTDRDPRSVPYSSIHSVAFSHSGKYAASIDSGSRAQIWDIGSGLLLRTGKPDWCNLIGASIKFPADDRYLLSSGMCGAILSRFPELDVMPVTTVRGVDRSSSQQGIISHDILSTYISLSFSVNGKSLVLGSDRGETTLYKFGKEVFLEDFFSNKILTKEITEIRKFTGHKGYVLSVSLSQDGKYVASAGDDSKVKIWNLATGKLLKTLKGHSSRVNSVAFSPDGKYVLSGSNDKTSRLWDVSTGKLIKTDNVHKGNVSSVVYSPDGKYAASGSWDKSIKLWETSSGRSKLLKAPDSVDSIAVSSDNNYLLSGNGKEIVLWDISKGSLIKRIVATEGEIAAVALSSDGQTILSGCSKGNLKLWDLKTGKEIWSLYFDPFDGRNFTGGITFVSFLSDGNTIVAMDGHGIHYIDLRTSAIKDTVSLYPGVALSPDGKYILRAAESADSSVKLLEVSTGKVVGELERFGEVFSASGKFAVTGNSEDGVINLWDIASGKEVRILKEAHRWRITSVAISPNNNYVLSGGWDADVKLWDISTGKELKTFIGHLAKITSVLFAADGKYIFSSSQDGTIRLWDLAGNQVATMALFEKEWVVLTADGYFNASAKGDEHINALINNEVQGIDKYRSIFFRPDLVEKKLTGSNK